MNVYLVTGSCHGSQILCNSDAEARKLFNHYYPSEPILSVKKTDRRCLVC